jgi:hypothetical protein
MGALFACCCWLRRVVPVGMFSRRIAKPPVSDTLAWIGLLFLGLFSSLFVLTVLRDACFCWVGS